MYMMMYMIYLYIYNIVQLNRILFVKKYFKLISLILGKDDYTRERIYMYNYYITFITRNIQFQKFSLFFRR